MAETLSADVVIVGAGAVGGMAAYKLAQAGVKTLILEAGPRIDQNTALTRFWASPEKGPNSPYENTPYAPHPEIYRPETILSTKGRIASLVSIYAASEVRRGISQALPRAFALMICVCGQSSASVLTGR